MSWYFRIASSLLLLALAGCSGIATPSAQPTSTIEALSTASVTPVIPSSVPPTPTLPPTLPPTPEPATAAPSPPGVISFPDPQAYIWELVVSGLERPVAVAEPSDGSGRMFVVEQPGVIRIYQDGILIPEPFLDIRERVGSRGNEQGLLGLAFHPTYAQNGYFYVNYTDLNGDSVIARFSVVAGDATRADAGSEERLLFVRQPYPNHNGGSVVFGPGGYLYLGLGDGGSGGDPQGFAQSLDTYLGKILRINVDSGDPYTIPSDNPFSSGSVPEIWAYGLRNPWRFSFDRVTGDVYIADVGQSAWEEVNFLQAGNPPGANFGWDYREGRHPYEGTAPEGVSLLDPVAEYNHSQGCSITGGYSYRGEELPAWKGIYLFGDFCSGDIWGLFQAPGGDWQQKLLFDTDYNISSFGEDAAGELYLIDLNGDIYRLRTRD